MRKSLSSVFSSSTFRHSSITFVSTVINGALGAVFFIVAARFLGPSEYGLFSVALAVLTLTSSIGNLGTDTGVVNFVSKYIHEDPKKAQRFLKLALKVKVIVGLLICALGISFSQIISQFIFQKPELSSLLQIAFIGVFSQLLFTFALSALQSFQKFVAWGGANVGQNAIRLLFLLGMYILGGITTSNILLLYALIPFAGFILGMIFMEKEFLRVSNENAVADVFFRYNVWVALFGAVSALSSRLDTFIIARLLDSTQIGLYGAANQLVQIVPQFVVALGTVIAPKMAQQNTKEKFVEYLKKTQLMILALAVLGILSIPIVLFLIPYIFGVAYLPSGSIFVVLLFAMLLFLISVPVHMAIYHYYSYPKLFFWLSIGHLILISCVGWYLITMYGVMGAAITVLIGQIYNYLIPGLWVINKLRT
jgi:O-antigen/teichoic acid export membrane protein